MTKMYSKIWTASDFLKIPIYDWNENWMYV